MKEKQKISKVFSGNEFHFAVEIKKIKCFAEFSNEEVCQIAEKVCLHDYLRIIKYSKVRGKN